MCTPQVLSGGVLRLHGAPRVSWTRLATNANAGAQQLTLRRAVDWQPGDTIVLAPTDFDPGQAETFSIAAVEAGGTVLQLNASLQYGHYGSRQSWQHPGLQGGQQALQLDSSAEVALLSRNIVFQGDPDCEDPASGSFRIGGHVKIMPGELDRV
jgi:hypothetical protein